MHVPADQDDLQNKFWMHFRCQRLGSTIHGYLGRQNVINSWLNHDEKQIHQAIFMNEYCSSLFKLLIKQHFIKLV